MVEGIAYHLGDFVEAYWSDKDMGKELREMFNRPAWKATHSNVITEVSPRGDLKNFYLPLWKFKHDKTTKNGRLAPGLALPPVLPHSLEMDCEPAKKLLAEKFLLASHPDQADATGATVTALTPVPPLTIGTIPVIWPNWI